MDIKQVKKIIRKKRIRAKVSGDEKTPRLSVFFSNKHISAQVIDDSKGKTLIHITDKTAKKSGKNTESAKEVGKLVAKKALEKKIQSVVFDKGSKKYHGRIKALAEASREQGLKF
ncbi:MAG: 50S ribosomal protein L18 [Patescibacteria group bacterium]|nr:50S ribosomal protein L18 [Patescibacteria group bacterium]MCL5093967.1 50S ribosomal protein L18 [Patescibacteria group bacterium]